MLFWERYQSTPDRFGNYQLEPHRFGYTLNGRGRVMFFKCAVKYFREGPFIMRILRLDEHHVESWTFQSRKNGYIFKLVGRDDEFILLQVDRRTFSRFSGRWDTLVIRNYFCFLAFVLNRLEGDRRRLQCRAYGFRLLSGRRVE